MFVFGPEAVAQTPPAKPATALVEDHSPDAQKASAASNADADVKSDASDGQSEADEAEPEAAADENDTSDNKTEQASAGAEADTSSAAEDDDSHAGGIRVTP